MPVESPADLSSSSCCPCIRSYFPVAASKAARWLTDSVETRRKLHKLREGGLTLQSPLSEVCPAVPTLPRSLPRSTIGAEGLSFRVRNVTGRFPFAMAAETLWRYQSGSRPYLGNRTVDACLVFKIEVRSSPRPISTGQLHASLHFHLRPINPVIYWGPYQINLWESLS